MGHNAHLNVQAIFSQNTVNVARKNCLSFAMAANQIQQFGLVSYAQGTLL